MRLAQKTLDRLPTFRMYYTPEKWFTVPYIDATVTVKAPQGLRHYRPNGRGLPLECGVSNAGMESKNLFPHDAFAIYTIPTASYVVCMESKSGQPRCAIRYSVASNRELVDAYDKSLANPEKWGPVFSELLDQKPFVTFRPPQKRKSRKGDLRVNHDPDDTGSHAKRGEAAVSYGNKRRMKHAGYIPGFGSEEN